MDDNSVGKWILPAMGALTALYFYNNLHNDNKVVDNSKNTINSLDNEVFTEINDEINKINNANKILINDSYDADILKIVKTKDTATHISESFIKNIEEAEENEKNEKEIKDCQKEIDDYETVNKSALQNIKSTDVSQKSRWWY